MLIQEYKYIQLLLQLFKLGLIPRRDDITFYMMRIAREKR